MSAALVNQKIKNTSNDSKTSPLKWASDVLDLELPNQTVDKSKARDRAIAAFFETLNSNDFYTETDSAAATEVLCGNPISQSLAYQRHKKQQDLQLLDKTLDVFARQLGVTPGPKLLALLKARLASLNPQSCSADAQRYAKKIWSTAQYVATQDEEERPAVKKLRQAIFHISTVRQTQRCRVRRQWVRKLRSEFSQQHIKEAKRVIKADEKKPGHQFHRPFLSLLTQQEYQYEDFRLARPVNSGEQNALRYVGENKSNYNSSNGRQLLWILILVSVFSGIAGLISSKAQEQKSSPKPGHISGKFKPELYDEKTLEVFRLLVDPPKVNPSKNANSKKQRSEEDPSATRKTGEQKDNPSSVPSQRPKPASGLPISGNPNSMMNRRPGFNHKSGPEQLSPRSPLNPRSRGMP